MNTRFLVIAAFLSVILGSSVLAAGCGGAVECRCGDTLVESHVMTYDLLGCPDVSGLNGINIGADNIVLDCDSHLIAGLETFAGNYDGVFIGSKQNATVQNCNIRGFNRGIYLEHSANNNTIQNNNASFNNHSGIATYVDCDDNVIRANTVTNNGYYGIHITDGSDRNFLLDNHAEKNTLAGIAFRRQSSYNVVGNNRIALNPEGIEIPAESNHNIIYNNRFENNNLSASEESSTNQWDYLGVGNYWSDFSTNPGFPYEYHVPGNGAGIDYWPVSKCIDIDGDRYSPYANANCPYPTRLDCVDNNAARHPGQREICNNRVDDNCNGQTDERCPSPTQRVEQSR